MTTAIKNIGELAELTAMIEGGFVSTQVHESGLRIFNYTPRAQYANEWNETTLTCRGLIVDENGDVVSRPFRKFFNLDQVESLPSEPWRAFEKLDGSLGITYWNNGLPHLATRGSFTSPQAIRGTQLLRTGTYRNLRPDCTYLFEIIYPENRIVVDYGERAEVVLLGVVETASGIEIDDQGTGYRAAQAFSEFNDIGDLRSFSAPNTEGFVIRFHSGFRVKVKTSEYVRLHKLLTGINERMILTEYLSAGISTDALLERVPDEFHKWVRECEFTYRKQYNAIFDESISAVMAAHESCQSRKDYAAEFTTSPYAGVMFAMLDNKPFEQVIWNHIKKDAKPGSCFKIQSAVAD